MMKKFTYLITLIFFSSILSAQITVTNSGWPNAGDTLKIAEDNAPSYVLVPKQLANANWDYSNLNKEVKTKVVYESASKGNNASEFPGADLFISTNAGEVYYNKTNTSFELLGFVGDAGGLGFPVAVKYKPANIERRNPMDYFDVNSFEYSYSVTLSGAIFPDSLLPVPVDSIRFGQNVKRLDKCDSWGKITIPGGTYDILRERRSEINTYSAEILTPFGWIDLSSLGGDFVPPPDTAVNYFHFAEGVREPILVLQSNSTGDSIQSAQFKDISSSGIFDPGKGISLLNIYPNPANQFVNIKMEGLDAGQYQLSIYNILGQQLRTEQIHNQGQQYEVIINTSRIDPGWYIISLKNKDGVTISSSSINITR